MSMNKFPWLLLTASKMALPQFILGMPEGRTPM